MLRTSQYLHWPINSYWADDWLLDAEFDAESLRQGSSIAGFSIGHYAELKALPESESKPKAVVSDAAVQQQAWEEKQRQKQLEKERIAEIEWNKQLAIEQKVALARDRDRLASQKRRQTFVQDPAAWAKLHVPIAELAKNPYWTGR